MARFNLLSMIFTLGPCDCNILNAIHMTENNHKEEHIADLEQATSKQVLSRIRWTGLCPGIFPPLRRADFARGVL